MQFPGVVSVGGMLAKGLLDRAPYLFETLGTRQSRIDFLSVTYPNASLTTIRNALDTAERSWSIGKQVQQGMGYGPLEDIPRNEGSVEPGQVGISTIVVVPDPLIPGKQRRIPIRIDVDNDISGGDLLNAVYDALAEMFANGDIPIKYLPGFEDGVDLEELDPQIIINAVTRG